MRKMFISACLACLAGTGFAGNIFESLDGWVLGANPPAIIQGQQHDSQDQVSMMQVGPGVNKATYDTDTANGTGMLVMWVYDSAIDLSDTNAGYPKWGPRWGIKNAAGQTMFASVCRTSAVAWSQGYEIGSSVNSFSFIWYQGGTRSASFSAGWYKWEFVVTLSDVTVRYHDTVSKVYDGTNSVVGPFMGQGANGVYIEGDGATGVETFKFDDALGIGVFTNAATTGVARPFVQDTWGNIKALFR